MRNVVAVDLGADSCRVSLARVGGDRCSVVNVHRFKNGPVEREGHLYWPIEKILAGVLEGIHKSAAIAEGGIDSIGIDGWAVDYVRMGSDSLPLDDPFCYRDQRTTARQQELWKKIPAERIYSITGIQMLRFNTVYQLYADRCDGVPEGQTCLNIPEYLLHRLGGKPVSEYTNATHTQMVECGRKQWSSEILAAAGIAKSSLPEIVPPGTILGRLRAEFAGSSSLRNAQIIAPACHDTGSAVAGIPSEGGHWAFLSSGTWSLVGAVLPAACKTDAANRANFSNEGGLGGSVRFLKNVNGMWLLQECMRHWQEHGATWPLETLLDACAALPDPIELLNVDDPDLMLPGNMPRRINEALLREGKCPLREEAAHAPRFANLIFHSLAARYADVLEQLSSTSGHKLQRLYIVGGGSKNEYLNRLVAEHSGLEIARGPVESSTIGNIAIQLATLDQATEPEWGVLPGAVSKWSRAFACAGLEANETKAGTAI